MNALLPYFGNKKNIEVGCDEVGRGCLAGPVVAAAVILPKGYVNEQIVDSKKINEKNRQLLKLEIQRHATAIGIGIVDHIEIDKINILNASILAMHRAIEDMKYHGQIDLLLIDGNKFKPYQDVNYKCIVKGDSKYQSIAAASIIAKTFRDNWIVEAHNKYPHYHWNKNKGYPSKAHIEAIKTNGICDLHRKTFGINKKLTQLNIFD
jgi:ribonuclease HII